MTEMTPRDALEVVRDYTSVDGSPPDLVEALAVLSQLVERAGEPVACEYRLWDSQWVSIVDHEDCFRYFDKEEAVAQAVRMTEAAMRRNIQEGKWPEPFAPALPPTAPGASHD